jgi:hypothetical protein
MACDLERLFATFAGRLPTRREEDVDALVIGAADLPRCPQVIRSDRILGHSVGHDYGAVQVDAISLTFASKDTCRQFGLLLLSNLFHEEPETVELQLTNTR